MESKIGYDPNIHLQKPAVDYEIASHIPKDGVPVLAAYIVPECGMEKFMG